MKKEKLKLRRGLKLKSEGDKVSLALDGMIKSLKKSFGKGVAAIANDTMGKVHNWIPVHPLIDEMLGGGFPCGRVTVIGGKSWAGKTLLISHGITNATLNGGYGIILNTETAFDVALVIKSLGIDYSKVVMIPDPDSGDDGAEAPSIEKCFEIIKAICKQRIKNEETKIPLFIGWDSLSQTMLENEEIEEVGDQTSMMGRRPKVIKQGFRHLTPLLKPANVAIVLTTQMIANVGAKWGPKEKMADANAIEYISDILLEVKRGQIKTKQVKGNKVPTKAIGNRLILKKSRIIDSPQGGEVLFDINFKKGITQPRKEKKKEVY